MDCLDKKKIFFFLNVTYLLNSINGFYECLNHHIYEIATEMCKIFNLSIIFFELAAFNLCINDSVSLK